MVRSGQAAWSSATTCSRTGRERLRGVAVELEAGAEAAAGEVEDVVDEAGHAGDAAADEAEGPGGGVGQGLALEDAGAGVDGGERVAEVVAEDGDELLAQLGALALAEEGGLAGVEALEGVEVEADEVGEEAEHAGDLGRRRAAGRGSMAQSVPKKSPSGRKIGTEM